MVKTILLSRMISPCIHSSVYEFESGYMFPARPSAFYRNRAGRSFIIVSIADLPFKHCLINPKQKYVSVKHITLPEWD